MEKEKMQRGGHVRIETEIRNIGLRTRKGKVSRSHQKVRGMDHIVPRVAKSQTGLKQLSTHREIFLCNLQTLVL